MASTKCKHCEKAIKDLSTAYHVESGKDQGYYCSKEEYENMIHDRLKEADFLEDVNFVFDLNIDICENISWSVIKQDITNLRKTYSQDEILWYINNYLGEAVRLTERKKIDKEFPRVKYLLAVLKNNIAEYLRNHPVPSPESEIEVDYYMAPIKYKPSNQRRALALIELEELEGDNDE